MTEQIDHAVEAIKLMEASLSDIITNHPAGMTASNALVARAQVEATLAVAGEVRALRESFGNCEHEFTICPWCIRATREGMA